jgi:hypothetical protein
MYRWVPREVTQDWLNQWRAYLPTKNWQIEGDAGEEILGNPDKSWNRTNIINWLSDNGVEPKGYITKSAALQLVAGVLNPVVEEEEELVEEKIELGDEE